MGTSVQLTPLAGAHCEGPLCYLLQVDDFRFLLDCGWSDAFDLSQLEPLVSVAPTIDAVLLSHSDTLHLGAVPYAVAKLGLDAPIYCTNPVKMMGHFQMYDHCLSRRAVSNFELFTLDDVDNAFYGKSHPLKYSQHFSLTGKGQGITITPVVAGRLLGGTIWKITKDTEDIIYAVDFSHRKEKHLNASVLESFTRPAVLITDAYNAVNSQPMRRQRDQEFIDTIVRTLHGHGNVLLPVETAGRVLELLLYLDQHWSSSRLTYPIAFLTNSSVSTIDFAKFSLEWMSDQVAKSFEQTRENVFNLKFIRVCPSRKDVDELPEPKVVLASMASLEVGFARDFLVEWAPEPRNLLLFTERAQTGTLARQLQAEPPPKFVKVTLSRKIPLLGEELEAYEQEQRRIKESNAAAEQDADTAAVVEHSEPAASDQPVAMEGVQMQVTAPAFHDVFVDGFTPAPGTVVPIFPLQENNSERDEYGEVINPGDFVIKEEYGDFSNQSAAVGAEVRIDQEQDVDVEKPCKVVTNETMVPVSCALKYLDFEGRADGRAIKMILARVSPLKLVLVHGSAEATEHLRQHCLKAVCSSVYTPRVGDTVNVTSDLNAYKLRLTEQLMSTILFKKLGDYELAWVDGQVGSQEEDLLPLLPLPDDTPPASHKTVLVGDLKLADFKHRLATKGVQAEFAGGVLRCGDHIAVRKTGGQQLVIEGPLCEDYFRIRELLYAQYHIL